MENAEPQRAPAMPAGTPVRTCLVVDDSSIVRRMASDMLRELGFEVAEAANGLTAVERCRAQVPDLILLDWNMPVMDGLACLKALRSCDFSPPPRIVLCTTEMAVSKIRTVLEAGADEYIIKPFDMAILQDKLVYLGLDQAT